METLEILRPEFRRHLEHIYKVEFNILSRDNPEDRINEWVQNKTDGKITELFSKSFSEKRKQIKSAVLLYYYRFCITSQVKFLSN